VIHFSIWGLGALFWGTNPTTPPPVATGLSLCSLTAKYQYTSSNVNSWQKTSESVMSFKIISCTQKRIQTSRLGGTGNRRGNYNYGNTKLSNVSHHSLWFQVCGVNAFIGPLIQTVARNSFLGRLLRLCWGLDILKIWSNSSDS